MGIINIIKSYWPALLGLILVSIFAFQEFRVSYYQGKLNSCKVQLKQSESLLTQQNIAIKLLQAESDKQEKQLREAEKSANDIRQASYKEVQNILNAKIPDTCQGAIEWGIAKANADNL